MYFEDSWMSVEDLSFEVKSRREGLEAVEPKDGEEAQGRASASAKGNGGTRSGPIGKTCSIATGIPSHSGGKGKRGEEARDARG